MSFVYDYARPMVSVDIIVVNELVGKRKVLLIKRLNDPYKNSWALPGGFVDGNEGLLDAAIRELKEETSLDGLELKQFYSYGDPNRDPRGHSISIVFYSLIKNIKLEPVAGDDAKEVEWFNLDDLPKMAFDHSKILTDFLNEKGPAFS